MKCYLRHRPHTAACGAPFPLDAYRRQRRRTVTAKTAGKDGLQGDVSATPTAPASDEAAEAPKKRNLFSHALNESFATEELLDELKDKQAFGQRGEAVLVAQLVVVGLVLFPPLQLNGLVYLAGVLALVAGFVACAYSLLCLGRSFSPLVAPRTSNRLVVTGMYQYMRHPLYSGLIMMAFGLAAVSYSESRLLLAGLLSLVLNYKAAQEEKAMVEKHGAEYETYISQVFVARRCPATWPFNCATLNLVSVLPVGGLVGMADMKSPLAVTGASHASAAAQREADALRASELEERNAFAMCLRRSFVCVGPSTAVLVGTPRVCVDK